MSFEADIVEQLQELSKWQKQQQEELMRKQHEQREQLSSEQIRLFEVLSSSISDMDLDEKTLKQLINERKNQEEANLIDFEEDFTSTNQIQSFATEASSFEEKDSEENSIMETPKVQLSVIRNDKNDSRQNTSYNSSFSKNNSTIDFLTDDNHSVCSERSHRSILIDDIPVPSPKKDFSTLLEEKLRDSDAVMTENKSKPIVKKPFLKKGQGLARFMPNANAHKTPKQSLRPRSASFSTTHSNASTKPAKPTNLSRCNSIPKSKKCSIKKSISPTPVIRKSLAPVVTRRSPLPTHVRRSVSPVPPVAQQKLTLKHVPPPQKKVINKSNALVPKIKFENKAADVVLDQSSSDLEGKTKKELEDVRIFELLEDKANNSSFCSTSSTVIAFLQQSTPLKHKALLHSATKHQISLNNVGDQTLEEIVTSAKSNNLLLQKQEDNCKDNKTFQWDTVPFTKTMRYGRIGTAGILPYGTDMDEHYDENSNKNSQQNDNNVSLHVRFAEYNEYNEYKTVSDTSSVSSDTEAILDFQNKGVWSDNSVTPDSSDAESVMSQTKITSSFGTNTNGNFTKKETADSEYDDDGDDESQDAYNADNRNTEEESEVDYEEETESKNNTMNSEDTIIEKDDDKSLFKSELLKKRLLELEQEIEIFRKESASLQNLKQKLQEERTNLHEERIKLQRSFKEKECALEVEKKKTESILQEEKKRLAREKIALENRMKDAYEKAQKSKQERQENQALREELEELREEWAQKENKWSATSARQRSQMRVLQAENAKLKQELEQLHQKQRARYKRATCPNTRAIHQINKFLADRKKISPFRNNEPDHGEEAKKPVVNVKDVAEEHEFVEDKPAEKEPKKVKIPKSIESIVRTRDLYEHLLKDATEDASEVAASRRSLLNRTIDLEEKNLDDDNYGGEALADHEDVPIEAGAVSPEPLEVEEEGAQFGEGNVEPPRVSENKQGIKEVHHADGRVEYWYPNGNVKKVFPDKGITKMIYYNGDVRETDKSGTVRYFYASTRTWHTTMPDGLEILEFPDGQVERRSKDGTVEVAFSDGSVRVVQADGSERWALKDGTIAETSADGEKVLFFPNGQREIHTKDHKRREYPDGTVKIVYPDGAQETRYANGRVRLKDKDGNLLMDTYQ